MKFEYLCFRGPAAAALVLIGVWGAGCATSEGAAWAQPTGARPAAALYDEWYDPAAVVLPPPPAQREKR